MSARSFLAQLHKTLFIVGLFLSLFLLSASSQLAFAADPSLSLQSAGSTYAVGQTFSVDINLNAGGSAHRETYLELNFDHTALEVQSIDNQNLYWSYSDQDFGNSTGTLTLRGNYMGNSYANSGVFARINFKVLSAVGASSLNFGAGTYIHDSAGDPFVSSLFTGSTYTLQAPQADATIVINSSYDQWALDNNQTISFIIDSQGNDIAGVDLVINYDSSIFEYQSMNWSGLFPNQQGFNVDVGNGVIMISGVSNQGLPINAVGEMVSFSFKGIALGSANFTLDWTAGSTTDTNIVSASSVNTDLLTSAPTPKTIAVIAGASLDFQFNLLGFLGTAINRSGTITVVGPNVATGFNSLVNFGAGALSNHNLGTFAFGNNYDLIIKLPGYLREKSANVAINVGVNGPVNFGNLKPGDINNDGVNNTSDLFQIYNYWNATYYPTADLNADGKVNSFDVGLLYEYFNDTDNI